MVSLTSLIAKNRTTGFGGLPCFCTANEYVLRAILAFSAKTGFPTVIEATCNQVNQDGGYTGMTPKDFMAWVMKMSQEAGVPQKQLILGGDHLGPNPWRNRPIEIAMCHARDLVRLYVEAGFTKIHLDASMACGGEAPPSFEEIAKRAADLCAEAEAHAPDPSKLFYIIGTEVPIPGGETEEPDALDVTSVERLRATIATHQAAWQARGLDAAWGRVVSVVTQPGVDFGHSSVYPFIPEKAGHLREVILTEAGLIFEAHSTDYQATDALAELVKMHFFFLKVGPELTFRFREAVFALAEIDAELSEGTTQDIRQVIEDVMRTDQSAWSAYYTGSETQKRLLRCYSYSDRIRYYWTRPEVVEALDALVTRLSQVELAETLISQTFGALEFGAIPNAPATLIEWQINRCIRRYFAAAGYEQSVISH